MKLTDKRFWLVWGIMLFLMLGTCLSEGWREDTEFLGGAYAISLISTLWCHWDRPKIAFCNLIVMLVYNAILSYNLVFNSQYGAGMTWWLLALTLTTLHSIILVAFVIVKTIIRRPERNR